MLTRRLVASSNRAVVTEVSCSLHGPRWSAWEPVSRPALVLVRRGAFHREVDGVTSVIDPTVAYLQAPGTEERFAHPHTPGDISTVIGLSPEYFAELTHPARRPAAPLPVSPVVALQHRRLLRLAAGGGGDALAALDHAIAVAVLVVQPTETGGAHPARPATVARRRMAVDDARQLLAVDPTIPLTDLADQVGVSPWYLSRTFHRVIGHTLTAHRQQLRAHHALELLAGTDLTLVAIAAACGYADQSHLTRSIHDATGRTPRLIVAETRTPTASSPKNARP